MLTTSLNQRWKSPPPFFGAEGAVPHSMRDLSSLNKPVPHAVEARSPNHWTTGNSRKSPPLNILNFVLVNSYVTWPLITLCCTPVSVAEEAINGSFWFSTNVSKVLHGSQQKGPFSVFMSTHATWVRGRHGGAGWWKDPGLECHGHGLFTEFR